MYKKNIWIAVTLMILCLGLQAQAQESGSGGEMTGKIIPLSHRSPESLYEIVKIYMSPQGKVAGDARTNSLVIRDYPENIARIEEVIKGLDIPQPQVRVYVNFIDDSSGNTSGFFAGAKKLNNNWVVGIVPNFSNTSSSIRKNMNLMAVSGTDAFIKIGERVPYTTWFQNYANGWGYIGQGVIFQDVSTGFFVTPTVRGDTINVRVAPGIYYFDGSNRNKIIFREMETTVDVSDGQTVAIGAGESSDSKKQGLISRILGYSNTNSNASFNILLTVKVVKGI